MPTTRREIRPVYALVGSNRFARNEALQDLLPSLSREADDLGPVRFDGEKADRAEVLDEVRTPSLLSARRLVIVDEADEFIKRHREALERYCSAPSETGTLILLCDSLPRNTRLYRIISKGRGVIPCEAPRGRALTDWIVSRAFGLYGKRLERPTAERLRDHLGDELGVLDAELAKLASYVGARDKIQADDVAEMTGNLREEKVFAVTDAIASRLPDVALKCWEQVVATDPAAPHRALAGLAYGIRRLLEARRDWNEGASLSDLAQRMHTDPTTLRRRLQGITVEQLEWMQRDLLQADLDVKTGLTITERAVEKFIVKHSSAGSQGGRSSRKESQHAESSFRR